MSVKTLEASVDRPGTIKVHAVSKADSVFGRDYVSQEEKMVIATAMMKINRKIMKETDSFKNFDIRDRGDGRTHGKADVGHVGAALTIAGCLHWKGEEGLFRLESQDRV